jgi:hypothetical protein
MRRDEYNVREINGNCVKWASQARKKNVSEDYVIYTRWSAQHYSILQEL